MDKWRHEGSGWSFNSIKQNQIVIPEISPFEGSSYFSLAKELETPMKELINIQNKDNECFRRCLFI